MSALEERLASIGEEVEPFALPCGRALPLVAPADEERCVELVRMAARDGLALVPLGAGSKLGWCHPPERADFALSTRRMAGVVRYEPGDGTVSARAGTPMESLAACVRAGGHHLTPELPRARAAPSATLGGCVAAGQSGLDRLRFGPLRNHLLGTRVLLADGTRPKSGGQLVKNVTGYDLHKLHCGSHGTLCLVLEAALRLFPLPADERVLTLDCADAEQALAHAGALLATPVKPLALLAHDLDEGAGWRLALVLAGNAARVGWERELALAALPGARELAGEEANAERARLRDLERWRGAWPTLELETTPSRAPALALALLERCVGAELAPRSLWQPGLARLACWFEAPERALALEATEVLRAAGSRRRWRGAPSALPRAELDRFGAPSPAQPMMQALRDALDPGGVFARGRFHGGL